MTVKKVSISLSKFMYDFVENYRQTNFCKTRSEVVKKALCLLQQRQLEDCYRAANEEIDNDFEITAFDGLRHTY